MPKGVYPRTMPGWSKGLTKHTDARVGKMAQMICANTRNIDIRECARIYHNSELSLAEVAEQFGVCASTLWKKFREAGFGTRNRKEAGNLESARQRQRDLRKGKDYLVGKRPCDLGLPAWNKGLTIDDPRVAKGIEALRAGRCRWGTSWNKGKSHSPEHRHHLSEAQKGRKPWNKGLTVSDPRIAASVSRLTKGRRNSPSSMKGKHLSEEAKRKIGLAGKGRPAWNRGKQTPREVVEKMLCTRWSDEKRQERSKLSITLWQDPEYSKKVYKNLKARPTKPELKLDTFLSKYFPEYEYNGDLRLGVVLGGLIPDFVNINGAKEVIEVFGERFHKGNVRHALTEEGRKERFAGIGYRCLVIWSKEIMRGSEEDTRSKILAFKEAGNEH